MNERERLVENVVKAASGGIASVIARYGTRDEYRREAERLRICAELQYWTLATWDAIDALRAFDAEKPKALKWGVHIVQAESRDWNAQTATHYLSDGKWCRNNGPFGQDEPHGGGIFATESDALAALDACTTPPPGYVEPTPLAENAGEVAESNRGELVGLYHRLEKRIDNEEQGRRAACDSLASRVAELERANKALRRDVEVPHD